MPELPDVERFRQVVEREALGRSIERTAVDGERLLQDVTPSTLQRRLKGSSFAAAARHGKHLFLELDGRNAWLRLHFGMTGEVKVVSEEEDPEYTRLRVDFADGGHLVCTSRRRLGQIGLVDDPGHFAEERGLGPDPWSDGIDLRTFRALLGKRKGAVKGTLMNQEVLAGLGNVYVDEILFQAGVPPDLPLGELDADGVARIHRTMGRVLGMAIENDADPGRMPDTWLLPHRNEGVGCPRCDGTIRKSRVAGRATYACDAHQGAAS